MFRSADPLAPIFVNDLTARTHVVGATNVLEFDPDLAAFVPIELADSTPGDCAGFDVCLDDRFGIDVAATDGTPGRALVEGDDSGLFTFLSDDEWQALIRVVNGCRINDHFWVFAAAATDVEYELSVTDTVTGESASYANPLDNLPEPITDTNAFATCP